MEDKKQNNTGSIISADLTIKNADSIRDFYKEVIGWDFDAFEMSDDEGNYSDYVAKDKSGNWVGGICHKRGGNKDLPPQWIVYVTVQDIKSSMEACTKLGGKVLKENKNEEGNYTYVLIEDPSGAILAITPPQEY